MYRIAQVFDSLEELGFETAGDYSIGAWHGYVFILHRNGRTGFVFESRIRTDQMDKRSAKLVTPAVRSSVPGLRPQVMFGNGFLQAAFRLPDKEPASEQLQNLLDALTSVLVEQGIAPADTCAVCGGAAPESLGFFGGTYQPVHAGCLQGLVTSAKDSAEDNRQNGSYLTGFLGALLGAVVGILPSLLFIALTDRIYAILFALIPLASMWCYRKLGGKMDRASIVIVVILSLLAVLLMTAVSAAMSLAKEYGDPFFEILPVILAYVVTAEGFVALLQDSVIPLIFLVLGVWIAWRFLRQTGDVKVQDAEAAAATLRPNPAYMTAQNAPVYQNSTGEN